MEKNTELFTDLMLSKLLLKSLNSGEEATDVAVKVVMTEMSALRTVNVMEAAEVKEMTALAEKEAVIEKFLETEKDHGTEKDQETERDHGTEKTHAKVAVDLVVKITKEAEVETALDPKTDAEVDASICTEKEKAVAWDMERSTACLLTTLTESSTVKTSPATSSGLKLRKLMDRLLTMLTNTAMKAITTDTTGLSLPSLAQLTNAAETTKKLLNKCVKISRKHRWLSAKPVSRISSSSLPTPRRRKNSQRKLKPVTLSIK